MSGLTTRILLGIFSLSLVPATGACDFGPAPGLAETQVALRKPATGVVVGVKDLATGVYTFRDGLVVHEESVDSVLADLSAGAFLESAGERVLHRPDSPASTPHIAWADGPAGPAAVAIARLDGCGYHAAAPTRLELERAVDLDCYVFRAGGPGGSLICIGCCHRGGVEGPRCFEVCHDDPSAGY